MVYQIGMGMLFSVMLAEGLVAATVPLSIIEPKTKKALPFPLTAPIAFPGEKNFEISTTNDAVWLNGTFIHLKLAWPANAPRYTGGLVWLKDRDNYWNQYILPKHLTCGATNSLTIPFDAKAMGWHAPGHSLVWQHRTRLHPQSIGFRIYADQAFTGNCTVVSATLETKSPSGSPKITQIHSRTPDPHVREMYELKFHLPDRYTDPFDPQKIDAGAEVITPSGKKHQINAFFYQPHYRLEDELGEPVEPDGPPEWRIRYCPIETGKHTIHLHAKDMWGSVSVSNAVTFNAAAARVPQIQQFVRVSKKDNRYFELDDGSLYYPIGHNIRSATDQRMDDKFPWIWRKPEGSVAYRRYFKKMRESNENWAEVWMSAWSLGLEWTEGIGGYHGAGDYHMGNAWELDRVLELAEKHQIHINLVLNYHGRISTWCDPEWQLHPYNKRTKGGWLEKPLEFFSDPQAIEYQKRFARYTQARWGWSPMIFGYELCSELNLTGHQSHHRTNFETNVVKWCEILSSYVKANDPYRHLVSVHVSNDYSFLNPAHSTMKTLDFNPLDAYHHSIPERIIPLAAETAKAGLQFQRPILITEFGGSPMAAGREHLKIEQHAALWAGVCVPLAGTPMFWWWQVVDENNLYMRYVAVSSFIKDIDPRDPSARQIHPLVQKETKDGKKAPSQFLAVGTASPTTARCYIYPKHFPRIPNPPVEGVHYHITIPDLKPGIYRIEFVETQQGKPIRKFDLRCEGGKLEIPIPGFKNDTAFKLHRIKLSSER